MVTHIHTALLLPHTVHTVEEPETTTVKGSSVTHKIQDHFYFSDYILVLHGLSVAMLTPVIRTAQGLF